MQKTLLNCNFNFLILYKKKLALGFLSNISLFSHRVELSSDEFRRQLQPFLFDKTEHFIHEFTSFARSPFDMTAYDERAQYNWPNESRVQGRDTPTVFHSQTSGVYRVI